MEVAKLYYQSDLMQDEIAKRLGLSRIKGHRLLRADKEAGILGNEINTNAASCIELEKPLMQAYDLRDAIVVPEQAAQSELYLALAGGAAEWPHEHLRADMRVGLGLGRTISHLPQVLSVEKPIACTFTEVIGGASEHSQGFATYSIT